MKYAYSNGRVKAMEAKLVSRQTMSGIINAKDGSAMLSLLFQTDYKREISDYGGVGIKTEQIDLPSRRTSRGTSTSSTRYRRRRTGA